ncbi:MAG: hypothetical protein H6704_01655 [Myxococcales bacterium]|nr:hypothetical protein [Myxococcales bacterium]
MRRAVALPLAALACAACAEEVTEPANKPSITSAQMTCTPVGGGNSEAYRLDRVEIIVLDLDGAEDIEPPTLWVGATSLPMEGTDIPKQGASPAGCGPASCERMFVWERGPDTAQLYCGSDGTLLDAFVEVTDTRGFFVRRVLESESI